MGNPLKHVSAAFLAASIAGFSGVSAASDSNLTRVQMQTENAIELNDDDLPVERRETLTGETVKDFGRERALVTEKYRSPATHLISTRKNRSSRELRNSKERSEQLLLCIGTAIAQKVDQEGVFVVTTTKEELAMSEVIWRDSGVHISAAVFHDRSRGASMTPEVAGVIKGVLDKGNIDINDGSYVYFNDKLDEIIYPASAGPSKTNNQLREVLAESKKICEATFVSDAGSKAKMAGGLDHFKKPISGLSKGPGRG